MFSKIGSFLAKEIPEFVPLVNENGEEFLQNEAVQTKKIYIKFDIVALVENKLRTNSIDRVLINMFSNGMFVHNTIPDKVGRIYIVGNPQSVTF
ncbi:hypothetical protein LIER_40796 [Lithospermum erythrorhizon]|uniref:Uncharacterized protein n=1 Tax=Lithospermum erythrorhizon TaxID=34254 RepID=A0AAV3R206_LITER